MNARQWKPGDAAIVRFGKSDDEWVGVRHKDEHGWISAGRGYLCDAEVTVVRPLVVIDPEDADVNRLIVALGTAYRGTCDTMRDALRSLVAPPRPEEPTGLGAVVEGEDGKLWVRVRGGEGAVWDEVTDKSPGMSVRLNCWYVDTLAVRVLSAGVES